MSPTAETTTFKSKHKEFNAIKHILAYIKTIQSPPNIYKITYLPNLPLPKYITCICGLINSNLRCTPICILVCCLYQQLYVSLHVRFLYRGKSTHQNNNAGRKMEINMPVYNIMVMIFLSTSVARPSKPHVVAV